MEVHLVRRGRSPLVTFDMTKIYSLLKSTLVCAKVYFVPHDITYEVWNIFFVNIIFQRRGCSWRTCRNMILLKFTFLRSETSLWTMYEVHFKHDRNFYTALGSSLIDIGKFTSIFEQLTHSVFVGGNHTHRKRPYDHRFLKPIKSTYN
jgi:hypothetical protein